MGAKRLSTKSIVFLSIFTFFFIITLVFIMVDADRKVERVLFFPEENGQELYGELRRLPVRHNLVGNIELYVDELLLGPESVDLYRLIPTGVKLESILLDDGTLYLGFSESLVTKAELVPMSFPDIIDGITKAVVFNFPEVKEVKTTIGGEPTAGS
ncbi:MAG: GerMN domain-containing protein [Spirochaetales bacterium]|nr:GerMN domain-containing protein [Spirochaetales bacterium]